MSLYGLSAADFNDRLFWVIGQTSNLAESVVPVDFGSND